MSDGHPSRLVDQMSISIGGFVGSDVPGSNMRVPGSMTKLSGRLGASGLCWPKSGEARQVSVEKALPSNSSSLRGGMFSRSMN